MVKSIEGRPAGLFHYCIRESSGLELTFSNSVWNSKTIPSLTGLGCARARARARAKAKAKAKAGAGAGAGARARAGTGSRGDEEGIGRRLVRERRRVGGEMRRRARKRE